MSDNPKTQLKVVFDTNVLNPPEAVELVKIDLAKLIAQHATHPDLTISWHVPTVVRDERTHQMIQLALAHYSGFKRFSRVVGEDVLPRDAVAERVKQQIPKHIEKNHLTVLALDTQRVKWDPVIEAAVFRRAPFELATEKGFRDALVVESFLQLVEDSPADAERCRLVLVTNDGLVVEAALPRLKDHPNASVAKSTEELVSLINTLVANAGVDFVEAIRLVAEKLFFDREKNAGLLYEWKLMDKIDKEFASELSKIPEGAHAVEPQKWTLTPLQFVKKEGPTMHWSSRLSRIVQAYIVKVVSPPFFNLDGPTGPTFSVTTSPGAGIGSFFANSGQNLNISTGTSSGSTGIGSLIGGPTHTSTASVTVPYSGILSERGPETLAKVPYQKGTVMFDVAWRCRVNKSQQLESPELEGYRYVGTEWG